MFDRPISRRLQGKLWFIPFQLEKWKLNEIWKIDAEATKTSIHGNKNFWNLTFYEWVMCACWSLCHMGPSINYAQVVLIKSVKNETLSTEDLQNVKCNKKRQHVSINVWPHGLHVMPGWQHQAHPLKWGGKWGSAFTYRADGFRV
jgi:hypothetical protein